MVSPNLSLWFPEDKKFILKMYDARSPLCNAGNIIQAIAEKGDFKAKLVMVTNVTIEMVKILFLNNQEKLQRNHSTGNALSLWPLNFAEVQW